MYIRKDPLMEQKSIRPMCGIVNCAYFADLTRGSSSGVHMCARCADDAQDRKWKRETGRKCLRCGEPPSSERTPHTSAKKPYVCVQCGSQLLNFWPTIHSRAHTEATIDAKYPLAAFGQFLRELILDVGKNNNPPTECNNCGGISCTTEAFGGKCAQCTLLSCLQTRQGCPPFINLLECPCGLVFPDSSPVPRLCTSCNARIGKHVAKLVEQGVIPCDFNTTHDENYYNNNYSDDNATSIAAG